MSHRIAILIAATALTLFGTTHAGSISGTVKFDGDVPKLKPVTMDADPGCAKKHAGPVPNEMLVLGDGNTMANILVYVKSGAPKQAHAAPAKPAVLDQEGCQYVPHVLGVMVGQPVLVKNSDGLLHNVHALPEINGSFNRAMPAQVTEFEHKFDKAESPFKIKCDVHPWMGAWVAVFDHPFFAVTGKDGKFTLDGLPDGSYEVVTWHERLPMQTQKVTVSGGKGSVDFTLSTPSK